MTWISYSLTFDRHLRTQVFKREIHQVHNMTTKPSLFDISRQADTSLSRVAYVVSRKSSSTSAVMASSTESLIGSYGDNVISGICLVQDMTLFNLIEGPTEVVYEIIKRVAEQIQSKESPYDKGKVVGSSDAVPKRVFGWWGSRIMVLQSTSLCVVYFHESQSSASHYSITTPLGSFLFVDNE